MIVLLAQDLMMTANAQQVSKRRASEFRAVRSLNQVAEILQHHQVDFLLVDLQLPNVDLDSLLELVSESNSKPVLPSLSNAESETGTEPGHQGTVVIGYAQHVHASLLSQARKLGVHRVVTRGQAMTGLEEILN